MTAVPELWGRRQDRLGGCRVSEKFCLKETAKRTIAEHLTLPPLASALHMGMPTHTCNTRTAKI